MDTFVIINGKLLTMIELSEMHFDSVTFYLKAGAVISFLIAERTYYGAKKTTWKRYRRRWHI